MFLAACGSRASEPLNEERPEEETEEFAAEVEIEPEEEANEQGAEQKAEDDTTWDGVKDQDNIVGKSNKDFSELTKSNPTEVRNDVTGNWRKSTISENVDIEEYALSYSDLHMEEGEVHHVVNFNRNTTTLINDLSGLLYVDVKEHVDGEEHDASTVGSGMLLKSYVIYPDGDIEEIQ